MRQGHLFLSGNLRLGNNGINFQQTYAAKVTKDFKNPNTSMIGLAIDFPKNTDKMFVPDFFTSLKSGTVATDIADNNTDDWVPF